MDENSSSGVDSDSGALKKRNIVNEIKELAHEINLSCLVTQHMMQNWEDRKFTDDQRNPVQKGISRCMNLVKFLKDEADDSIDKFTEIQKGPGPLSSIPGLSTKSADDSHATTSDSSSKKSKIPKITSPIKKRTQVNHGTTPESHLRNLCEQVSKFVYFITKLILPAEFESLETLKEISKRIEQVLNGLRQTLVQANDLVSLPV